MHDPARALLLVPVFVAACATRATVPASAQDPDDRGPVFEIVCDPATRREPFTGRALVYFSKLDPEPRTASTPARLEPVIAADFVGVPAGMPMRIDATNARTFPAPAAELEGGTYRVQAVLDVVPDAPWPGRAVGNPMSAPSEVRLGGGRAPRVRLRCDRTIPSTRPAETRTVRVVEFESQLLSAFHGGPTRLRALVHLPEAWFAEPERRFPALLYLSGFGATLGGFQSVEWPAPPIDGEPFVTVYPDPSCPTGHSGFVNGANNGPWGDAFVEELLPVLTERYRLVDDREGRVLAGHSSGAWAALWLIALHPATFGAAWASSPDPVDFRDFMGVDLYAEDANLLVDDDGRPRPFCKLGDWTVNYTVEHARRERVVRGGVLEFFEALLGGRAADGKPERVFDRATGRVDPEVVAHWRRRDLSAYLRQRWDELGPLLDGRLVVTVGDRDNFLLQGSVELLRQDLESRGADLGVHVISGDHFSELDGTRSATHLGRIVDRFRAWRAATGDARDASR
jgi:S-formylglutathione hydrolase FrmB